MRNFKFQISKVVIARTPMAIGGRGNLPEKIPTLGFGLARNDRGVKGFTLIELLIVIVIIGILAALIMANFVGIRQRARDGRRKADLRTIQSALELYRSDQGGYPSQQAYDSLLCGAALSSVSITYLQKIPCDPSGSSTKYKYTLSGTTYSLIACLENGNDGEKDANKYDSCSVASYTLNNP